MAWIIGGVAFAFAAFVTYHVVDYIRFRRRFQEAERAGGDEPRKQ